MVSLLLIIRCYGEYPALGLALMKCGKKFFISNNTESGKFDFFKAASTVDDVIASKNSFSGKQLPIWTAVVKNDHK